jgi:hypothetical protein
MPNFRRGVAEILEHEHTHRAGATASVTRRSFDLAHHAVEALPLSHAYLCKRTPQLRLKAHAGSAARGNDAAGDQSTVSHVRSLCNYLETYVNEGLRERSVMVLHDEYRCGAYYLRGHAAPE